MKTKIIYISGSEVFDMADIRAAFDTVRAALALDNKTVLFGVPVDNDDAFASDKKDDKRVEIAAKSVVIPEQKQPAEQSNIIDIPVVNNSTPVEQEIDIPVAKPKKSTRNTAKVVPIKPVEPIDNDNNDTDKASNEKSAIPILSVLGATSDTNAVTDSTVDITEAKPIDIAPEPINIVTPTDVTGNIQPDVQPVTLGDMLADDTAPVDEHEKTLEELLESMTPLGEDEKIAQPQVTEPEPMVEKNIVQSQATDDDTDATLELLATEFAESADKIVTPTKTETRGKIGKLKNILPFKKAKHDDSGLMGDLFGWAGVANDEDFTIPGFFANASSKK